MEDLFLSVNWLSGRHPKRLIKALKSSSLVITAWDGDKLVGLLRGLDDGEMVAFLHYLLVHPEYQGMGIAKHLLQYASGANPYYNGNISVNYCTNAKGMPIGYNYVYDDANRLKAAIYQGIGNYTTAYSYDKNSNIEHIVRGGFEAEANGSPIWIDNLTLSYNGNQLIQVTDSGEDSGEYGAMEFVDRSNTANEYAYDSNCNMTRDLNKGISNITYNLLNLPGEITFSDGRKVKYIYTADGAKVRTTYFDATGSQTLQVDYCGNYILRNGEVDRILTPRAT